MRQVNTHLALSLGKTVKIQIIGIISSTEAPVDDWLSRTMEVKIVNVLKLLSLMIFLINSSGERDTLEVRKQDTFGENMLRQGTQPTNVRHLRRRRKYVEATCLAKTFFAV